MPRNRTPNAKAELTGQTTNHPGRFAARNDPTAGPLGDPPDTLNETESAIWHEMAGEIPWLRASDRGTLENACQLRAIARTSDDNGEKIKAINALRLCLSALGATPVDRSKVTHDEQPDDPLAAFRN